MSDSLSAAFSRSPVPQFTHWKAWAEREGFSKMQREMRGLWLLARFAQTPVDYPKPLDEAVIYIGAATEESIDHDWNHFAEAAFHQAGDHPGGQALRVITGGHSEGLYVAASPVAVFAGPIPTGIPIPATRFPSDNPQASKAIAEEMMRALMSAYIEKNGRAPICNR